MRKLHGKRLVDVILANRTLLEKAIDFGLGLDKIDLLDLSGYIFDSQFHNDTTPAPI